MKMIVENQSGEDGAFDRFQMGMRVLAVDDDPICLKSVGDSPSEMPISGFVSFSLVDFLLELNFNFDCEFFILFYFFVGWWCR